MGNSSFVNKTKLTAHLLICLQNFSIFYHNFCKLYSYFVVPQLTYTIKREIYTYVIVINLKKVKKVFKNYNF